MAIAERCESYDGCPEFSNWNDSEQSVPARAIDTELNKRDNREWDLQADYSGDSFFDG